MCLESADAGHRYSGSLQALSYVLAAWYREHPLEAQPAIGALDPRILEDLRSLRGFWDSKRGAMSDLVMVGHDAVLKGLGHERGVRSYGGMVDLMIGWERRLSE